MIKKASRSDIPAMVEMGERFLAMSPHSSMGEYNGEAVARMLAYMVDEPKAIVLTNGDGAIGGLMAPLYFCPDKIIMEESFWFAGKGGRDLLREFIRQSLSLGAAFISLSTLANARINAVDRIVQNLGFTPVEQRYIMRA